MLTIKLQPRNIMQLPCLLSDLEGRLGRRPFDGAYEWPRHGPRFRDSVPVLQTDPSLYGYQAALVHKSERVSRTARAVIRALLGRGDDSFEPSEWQTNDPRWSPLKIEPAKDPDAPDAQTMLAWPSGAAVIFAKKSWYEGSMHDTALGGGRIRLHHDANKETLAAIVTIGDDTWQFTARRKH